MLLGRGLPPAESRVVVSSAALVRGGDSAITQRAQIMKSLCLTPAALQVMRGCVWLLTAGAGCAAEPAAARGLVPAVRIAAAIAAHDDPLTGIRTQAEQWWDRIALGVASFLAKLRLMRKNTAGEDSWRFRHDKIMEWFLRAAGTWNALWQRQSKPAGKAPESGSQSRNERCRERTVTSASCPAPASVPSCGKAWRWRRRAWRRSFRGSLR